MADHQNAWSLWNNLQHMWVIHVWRNVCLSTYLSEATIKIVIVNCMAFIITCCSYAMKYMVWHIIWGISLQWGVLAVIRHTHAPHLSKTLPHYVSIAEQTIEAACQIMNQFQNNWMKTELHCPFHCICFSSTDFDKWQWVMLKAGCKMYASG